MALFLFLAWAAVHATDGRAQRPTFREEWAAGVTGGINYSTVFFAPKVHQSPMQGFNAGVAFRWITERNLGLQLEAGFRMGYYELPVLTHIYFGSERVRCFFNLGPQIGLLTGESTDENLNGATPNKTNDQHTMAIERRFAWGLCGGPGVELRTSVGYFQLEGRYYYSLGDFYSTRHGDAFSKASPFPRHRPLSK